MKELSTRAGFGLGLGFLIKPINTYRKSKLQGVVWEFPKGTHTRKRKERVEVVFVLIGKEERKG